MTLLCDYQASCYSMTIRESVAVIDFFGDVFELGTCLDTKKTFLTTLHSLNDAPEIRAVLFLNSAGALGDDKYCRFVSPASEARAGNAEPSFSAATCGNDCVQIEQLGNALNQLILEIVNFRKFVIMGFEGEVAPPFFGAGLGADFRFGSDEMTFQPSYVKLGIVPSGGLGFFLPRMVGHRRSRDLLFSDQPTAADELCRIGLLDGRFPCAGFHEECIQIANNLACMPLSAIAGIKSVTKWDARQVAEFLEREAEAQDRAMIQRLTQSGLAG